MNQDNPYDLVHGDSNYLRAVSQELDRLQVPHVYHDDSTTDGPIIWFYQLNGSELFYVSFNYEGTYADHTLNICAPPYDKFPEVPEDDAAHAAVVIRDYWRKASALAL